MATSTRVKNIVELFNANFEGVGVEESNKTYEDFYDRSATAVVNKFNDETRIADVKETIDNVKIDNKRFNNQIYNMVFLSAVVSIIVRQKLSKKDKLMFAPVKKIMKQYRRPKILSRKIAKFSNAITSNNFKNISKTELKAFTEFKKYVVDNEKIIKQGLRINDTRIASVNKRMRLSMSRDVYRNLIKETKVRKEVTVNGVTVKRPLSQIELKNNVKQKMLDQTAWKVERTLKTELHAMEQNTRFIQHKLLGYTHKQNFVSHMNTRDDHLVQDTEVYRIDTKFRLGKETGVFYGDSSFGTQNINCNCWHEYFRK